MNALKLKALLFLSFPYFALAQLEPQRQFDFWIGEWDIDQQILGSDGKWLAFTASTEVGYLLDSHAIEEHWQGEVQFYWEAMESPVSLEGFSLRYYDEESGSWQIFWMDSRNTRLGDPFSGRFSSDSYGEFYRYSEKGQPLARISFNQLAPGRVLWELAVPDGQAAWLTVWKMNMTRKQEQD